MDWTRQIQAKVGPETTGRATMLGTVCAVTESGVYVRGVMKRGSVIDDLAHTSSGKEDIWISYISTETKDLFYGPGK